DNTRLIELACAAIDEFNAERGLARSNRAFQQNDVAARNAARKNRIQACDSAFHHITFRHHRPPRLRILLTPDRPLSARNGNDGRATALAIVFFCRPPVTDDSSLSSRRRGASAFFKRSLPFLVDAISRIGGNHG